MARFFTKQRLELIVENLNNVFTFDTGELHIDNSKYQLTVEASQRRIVNILQILSVFLLFLTSSFTLVCSYENAKQTLAPKYYIGKSMK